MSLTKIASVALFFLLPLFPEAQVDCDPDFLEDLETARIDFIEPLEGRYRAARTYKNDFQPCDFAIRSRKEHLEIRYIIDPYTEGDRSFFAPHVLAAQKAAHLAVNAEGSMIAGHDISEPILQEGFKTISNVKR